MRTSTFLIAVLMFWTMGCASTRRPDPRSIDWKARIGSYTYDQAVAEFGPPDVIGESSAGRHAEWVTRRRSRVSFGLGLGTGSYGPHSSVGAGVGTSVSPRPRGDSLRLIFDEQGLLKEWSTVTY